jgi:hypothetical protein
VELDRKAFSMKILIVVGMVCLLAGLAVAQGITVQKIQGDVRVRHGVTEQWTVVAAGDVLRPDDSMKTGAKGTAVVVAVKGSAPKRISLPPEVVVDIIDIRDLTPEELMLKLTMERVRMSPTKSDENPSVPNAAVIHGADRGGTGPAVQPNDAALAGPMWNGARVLFENGFYSTCALKGMELSRLFPATAMVADNRLMIAQSLDRAGLRGEAITEYHAVLGLEHLSSAQETAVRQRLSALQQH